MRPTAAPAGAGSASHTPAGSSTDGKRCVAGSEHRKVGRCMVRSNVSAIHSGTAGWPYPHVCTGWRAGAGFRMLGRGAPTAGSTSGEAAHLPVRLHIMWRRQRSGVDSLCNFLGVDESTQKARGGGGGKSQDLGISNWKPTCNGGDVRICD